MNVAGPSRLVPRGNVESTYEDDLLGLLTQLGLDEIDEMQTFFGRAGNLLSDHDVAMSDLLQQARALAVFNEDRALAQRVAAGEDIAVGQRPAQRPAVAPRVISHGTGAQRGGIGTQPRAAQPTTRNNTVQSKTWGGWFSSMVDWMFGEPPAPQRGPTNPPAAASKTPVVNRPTGHNCVICQDPIYGAEIRAPCGHFYGIDCITDLFQSATRDETLFPPRCCRQNIPFAQVQPHLSQALITTFQEKQVEFTTLKRVYCSSPACSRFLGPLCEAIFASRIFVCPAPGCGRRTCGKCRGQHSGDWMHNCRPDADATQVLALGQASGWARCPGCSQMIELHIGCFHMTCRCRTEFCYLCRALWKTCRCPQWDERRLVVAAEERVDARLGLGGERAVRRDVPAQRAGPVPAPAPANRVQVGARPAVPVPAPVPPARPLALARPPAPAHAPAVTVQLPQPTPPRAPTASSSTARPTSTAAATAGISRNANVDNWRNSIASTSRPPATRTSTPGSAHDWGEWLERSESLDPWASRKPSTSASTSTSASASRPTWASLASTSASKPPPAARPKTAAHADPVRQRLVQEMVARLREDHECDHGRWRYRSGGGICQSCGHHLPLYLFRCQGCEMLACNRCRRNRL